MKPFDNERKGLLIRNAPFLLLAVVMALGAFFRLFNFWEWSLTNDELSALNRLNVSELSILFEKSIKPDGHPAITQLFLYYWVKLVGQSTFALRLPFVLAGIGSLIYFYLGAAKWFNKKAALLASIVFACSQFIVLYAQIARPYALGLFFVLAFNYYWSQFIFKKKKTRTTILGFTIFAALGIMTHYFASLSIILQLFIGLFLLRKQQYKAYIFALILAAMLCLPHLGITLQQLQIGGLNWLPMPSADFFPKFLSFSFNESSTWISLILLAMLFVAFNRNYLNKLPKVMSLLLLAFVPFIIGYAYSLTKSPVLQRSVLIFSFPFLILLLFSFVSKKLPTLLYYTYAIILLLVGTASLLQTNMLSNKPFANFKAVAQNISTWKQAYDRELLSFSNANDPFYFDYYLADQAGETPFRMDQFRSSTDVVKAIDLIKNSDKAYLSLSFAVFPIPLEVYEVAKKEYPIVLEQHRYYISDALLLKKGSKDRKVVFETKALSTNSTNWTFKKNQLIDSNYYSAPHALSIEKEEEYPITFKAEVGRISSEKNRWLNTTFQFKSQDTCQMSLVFDVSRKGESIYWRAFDTKAFYKKNEWSSFIAVWERPGFIKDSDELAIFIWNLNQCKCAIDEFSILNFVDSDYNYYKQRID